MIMRLSKLSSELLTYIPGGNRKNEKKTKQRIEHTRYTNEKITYNLFKGRHPEYYNCGDSPLFAKNILKD